MSELRIALVAEGPTDYEVIQAALKAVLPEPFVMIQLQPEATGGMMGTGWCGVLKWIQAAQQRHSGTLGCRRDTRKIGHVANNCYKVS